MTSLEAVNAHDSCLDQCGGTNDSSKRPKVKYIFNSNLIKECKFTRITFFMKKNFNRLSFIYFP
jgi:hypothetical protein